jgi:hypothetical protein
VKKRQHDIDIISPWDQTATGVVTQYHRLTNQVLRSRKIVRMSTEVNQCTLGRNADGLIYICLWSCLSNIYRDLFILVSLIKEHANLSSGVWLHGPVNTVSALVFVFPWVGSRGVIPWVGECRGPESLYLFTFCVTPRWTILSMWNVFDHRMTSYRVTK